MNDARQLRAGRDYPLWPVLKWNHARRLSSAFAQDFNLWRLSLGTETRAEHSEDRTVVTFYASLATPPPAYEWSLQFGDIVHNYRSALDALAWAMANLDGNTPDEQYAKQIYFPMKSTIQAFDKEARTKLSSVPGFVLERMAMVQPYHVKPGQKATDGVALILHDLDIADKHKAALEVQVLAADKTSYGVSLRPMDPSALFDHHATSYEWLAAGLALEDGAPIVRMTFPAPVKEARIDQLPIILTVHRGEASLEVFDLLRMIDRQVSQTFSIIETGTVRAE